MAARSKARKRALDILFEADQRGLDAVGVLAERVRRADPPVPEYAVEIVEGVSAHLERIDELLATYAQGWTVDRMPGVDRALLRLSTWELLWNDEVPDAVAIDEAVELARSLSTDDSPAFVNGLLARLLGGELLGQRHGLAQHHRVGPLVGVQQLVGPDPQDRPVDRRHAVELAHSLSTDESPAFVNGLLARLLAVKPTVTR